MTKATGKKRWGKARGRPRKEGADRHPETGRITRVKPARAEENKRAVIIARCKIMGWLPRLNREGIPTYLPTADMAMRASQPWMGCPAGRAIEGEPSEVRAELWEAVKRVSAVYWRYWLAIGAPPPYAKSAALAYLPESLGSEGVEASEWDDRSEQEKVEAATRAMMKLEQALGMAGEGVAAEVKGVVLAEAEVGDYRRLVKGLRAAIRGNPAA